MRKTDRAAAPGGTAMLVLALLSTGEMYGYQIIEELERRSEQVFRLQEGTQNAAEQSVPVRVRPPAPEFSALNLQSSGLFYCPIVCTLVFCG